MNSEVGTSLRGSKVKWMEGVQCIPVLCLPVFSLFRLIGERISACRCIKLGGFDDYFSSFSGHLYNRQHSTNQNLY